MAAIMGVPFMMLMIRDVDCSNNQIDCGQDVLKTTEIVVAGQFKRELFNSYG